MSWIFNYIDVSKSTLRGTCGMKHLIEVTSIGWCTSIKIEGSRPYLVEMERDNISIFPIINITIVGPCWRIQHVFIEIIFWLETSLDSIPALFKRVLVPGTRHWTEMREFPLYGTISTTVVPAILLTDATYRPCHPFVSGHDFEWDAVTFFSCLRFDFGSHTMIMLRAL
jgi:hypothetical protein